MIDYITITILSAFTVLSIVFQLRNKFNLKKIWKLDKYGIIPNYSFFAPLPLTNDFRIIYRLTINDMSKNDFEELDIYQYKNWYQCLFNPFKYYNKGLIDLCVALLKEYKNLEQDSKKFIQVSSNYIGILNIISDSIKSQNIDDEVEFSIVATQDRSEDRKASVVFRSFKHKII
ncbi:hypothetical protein KCTC32516_02412 [Polaribacter huanghezhanensis]|uniref:hypothetical protein n=1 Tax=Polaribacter huanghezhanensis TaxID=1354726 RepID=UPI002647A102|nr:hypothetical protein [Polaribacter huanghezhanensis]WKD87032.1 hypothetical protein KCTC32516_02412 [Polaribacter huanghezhanensis]